MNDGGLLRSLTQLWVEGKRPPTPSRSPKDSSELSSGTTAWEPLGALGGAWGGPPSWKALLGIVFKSCDAAPGV